MERAKLALIKLAEGTFIPAHPLALNSKRKFDEKRQRALTRYYLAAGAGGIAVGVHTTQFEIREAKINLFKPVLKIAVEEIERFEKKTGKTIIKIAGVCGEKKQAIKEADIAKEIGYDAVLLSPGGLPHLSEEELIKRTKLVSTIIPVIGFYLQPSVGGRFLSYNYWEKFCEIDNVVAIKCAAFNRYQTLDVVRAVALADRAGKIALYTGNDDNIIIDLLTKYSFRKNNKTYTKRFVGGLLGHWAVWTKTAIKIFQEIKETLKIKDNIPEKYLTLAQEVTDANAAFFDVANNFKGCIAGIHEVLRRQGLLEGIWCLNEEEMLSPGQNEEIDRVYKMYPHLNDDKFVINNINKWF